MEDAPNHIRQVIELVEAGKLADATKLLLDNFSTIYKNPISIVCSIPEIPTNIVKAIINYNSVRIKDGDVFGLSTPLKTAALSRRDTSVISLLIEKKAKLDNNWCEPMRTAIDTEQPDVCELLLDAKAEIPHFSSLALINPIRFASLISSRVECLKVLLERRGTEGVAPLREYAVGIIEHAREYRNQRAVDLVEKMRKLEETLW